MNLTKEQEQLLEMTAEALFEYKTTSSAEIDYEVFIQEAKAQTVLPLIYEKLKECIPSQLSGKLHKKVMQICVNNIHVNYEHVELHQLLTEQHIPYVIMKGSVAAFYYPHPELRVMGDVDFLVRKSDLDRAGNVLEKIGFQPVENNENESHLAYYRYGSAWEMHWEPNGVPGGKTGNLIRQYLSDIIDQAQLYRIEEGAFMGPSVFHHGLILLLHTATHLINTGIGLRHLCDWAVFVNGLTDDEFLKLFEEPLKNIGLWRFAQLLTLLSERYLHIRACNWTGDTDEKLLENMMADIFAGGNFGQKDSQRINQAKLMTNANTGSVTNIGMIRQLIRTMNEKAHIGFPITKRIPFLIPVGWIYVGMRHLLRIRKGIRPEIQIESMIQGASKRKEIYKQFHLFDNDL